MDFEHTLLLVLFILPLAYKIAFWKEIFSGDGSLTQKFILGYSHFWTYVEFPLFLGSFVVYFNPNLEIFFFNFLLYLFALMHVFLLGKVFRGQKILADKRFFHFLLALLCALVCFFIGDFWKTIGIYAPMTVCYIFLSLILGYKEFSINRYQEGHFGK